MIAPNIAKAIARYYVRLKLEEMIELADRKGDKAAYHKYKRMLKKLEYRSAQDIRHERDGFHRKKD